MGEDHVIGTTTHPKGKPSGENFHFLGYSSDHHAAFKLLKWGSDRMVVRGHPHRLKFLVNYFPLNEKVTD